jgi:hypothetical protein
MGSISVGERNKMLDAVTGGSNYTAPADCYVQLHTGDPGAAGTSNVATETDRVAATFGTPASSGAIANTAAVEWTNVAATETYTHVSLWSASSGGTFLGSDDRSSSAAVTAGDTFRIPTGDLDVTIS